jgi:hypothetical protein
MEINMRRIYGGEGISVLECINPGLNKYKVRMDFQPLEDNETGITGVSFIEHDFSSKPTIDDIKEFVHSVINAQTDEKILSGYTWSVPNSVTGESESVSVWLSSENQFNYKAAFDLAMQTNGQNLPVVFKLGTAEEPVYHTFTELSELQSFYIGAVSFINQTLAEGWQKKDDFDFAPYEAILNPTVTEEEIPGESE